MCFGMGCIRESESSGTCHDPSRCLMEARERAEEQAQGEAAANRLAMLRRAYATRHAVAVVLIDSLTDGGPVHGIVGWVQPNGLFAVAMDDGRLRFHIPPAEIGQRIFVAGGWPDDESEAFEAGPCPACGEALHAFPVSGVVACSDCDWGVEIPPAAPARAREVAHA